MGSNEMVCENNNYYAENTVFVAVGKHMKESESVLSYAVQKFAGKKRICILHIHQPAQLVTFCKFHFSLSSFLVEIVWNCMNLYNIGFLDFVKDGSDLWIFDDLDFVDLIRYDNTLVFFMMKA